MIGEKKYQSSNEKFHCIKIVGLIDVLYKTDVVDFMKETVIKNHLLQLVERDGVVVSNELIDNESKFLILLNMLERLLEESSNKYLLLIKNPEEYISKNRYQQIVERILRDSNTYGNLYVLNFIIIGGCVVLFLNLVESVNIIGDYIESPLRLLSEYILED